MSPTLDLADDCFRFVTTYFEIINASAPHIYHSALALAPQKSIVRKLYESHAHPFTRVVRGAPMLWDLNTATTTHPSAIDLAVWAPCNRFIAITLSGTVDDPITIDVLDAVTLQRLQTLEFPRTVSTKDGALVFSPNSRILTWSSRMYMRNSAGAQFVVSWDLQTGGVASVIRLQGPDQYIVGNPSITYSEDGKMVGVLYQYHGDTASIFICDVVTGVHTHSHSLNGSIACLGDIWTRGESLQFATASTTAFTIWGVGFVSGGAPTVVETLPVPDDFDLSMFPHGHNDKRMGRVQLLLLPILSRLALAFEGKILVWDAQHSKFLLCCTDTIFVPRMSFSRDGLFFACLTTGSDIYLWKESSTGYVLHEILAPGTAHPNPLLSQNGESIVAFGRRTTWLWRTNEFTTLPSSISTRAPRPIETFALDFSPDGTLAVTAMNKSNTVTILNLKSDVPQLTIDVGVRVDGLRVVGDTVVVIGDRKVIAWDLLAGAPDAGVSLQDSSWSINLGGSQEDYVANGTISPDSRYVALATMGSPGLQFRLCIYSASTGEYLGHGIVGAGIPWFAPDGRHVWYATTSGTAMAWRIGSGEDVLERLEHAVDIEHPPEGYPWGSSRGYRVTKDWWILGPDEKRLLMLPPTWQSFALHRVWKGQFLALLHSGLSEPVILEVEP